MKKLYAVLLGALLVLGGCGLFTPVEYTKNFKINGVVINGATGELVQGATVIWTSFSEEGGKEFTTSENGVFNIGGGEHGSYTLYVKKDGFTNNALAVEVDGTSVLIPDMGITSYDSTVNAEIIIYPTNKSVTFNIKLKDDNFGNKIVDTTIPVYAKLVQDTGSTDASGNIIYETAPYNPVYTGSIDASGNVTLGNLPASPSVEIGYGAFEVGTHMYAAAALGILDLTAADETLADQELTPTSGTAPSIISTNLDDNFGVTDTISVTFNKAIDDEESSFDVSGFAVEETWAADMKSVTLEIDRTLAIDTAYVFNYTLTTTDGYVGAASTVSFSTTEGIDYVSSNIGEYGFNSFTVTDNIVINFNQDIDRVENFELLLGGTVLIQTAYSISGSTLTIDPVGDLHYSQSYELSGTVYGAGDNATNSYALTGIAAFTTEDEVFTVDPLTTPVITLTGNFDYDTTGFSLSVTNPDATTDTFYVYARVQNSDMDWINVGSVANTKNDYDYGHEYSTLALGADLSLAAYNSYFDIFVDDAIQTPFPNDTVVEFKVLGYTNGVFSADSNIVTAEDTVSPEVDELDAAYTIPAEWVEGFVDVGAVTTMVFTLPMTEYITGLPVIANFVKSTNLATATIVAAVWATSAESISITMTLPAGITLADTDYFYFEITDSSGNGQYVQVGFDATAGTTDGVLITYPTP